MRIFLFHNFKIKFIIIQFFVKSFTFQWLSWVFRYFMARWRCQCRAFGHHLENRPQRQNSFENWSTSLSSLIHSFYRVTIIRFEDIRQLPETDLLCTDLLNLSPDTLQYLVIQTLHEVRFPIWSHSSQLPHPRPKWKLWNWAWFHVEIRKFLITWWENTPKVS